MPIYDYRCDHCGHAFSAIQSFKDEALGVCPNCGLKPRRLLVSPALVFKGSGWYVTDSRKGRDKGEKAESGDGGDKAASGDKGGKGKADKGGRGGESPGAGEGGGKGSAKAASGSSKGEGGSSKSEPAS